MLSYNASAIKFLTRSMRLDCCLALTLLRPPPKKPQQPLRLRDGQKPLCRTQDLYFSIGSAPVNVSNYTPIGCHLWVACQTCLDYRVKCDILRRCARHCGRGFFFSQICIAVISDRRLRQLFII